MPITSGSIEYERRLNLGEYNHKNIISKISWVVEPNEDDELLANQAIQKALSRVTAVLNCVVNMEGKPTLNLVFPPPPEATPNLVTKIGIEDLETIAAPNLAAQHPAAEITAGIPPAVRRHRRTKAEMEAARAAENPLSAEQISSEKPSSTPSTEPDPTLLASSEPTSGGEPGMPSFGSFDPDLLAPAEVTDLDLQNACQARVTSGLPHAPIKELVAKFSPGALFQTPQEARRRFLDELAKL